LDRTVSSQLGGLTPSTTTYFADGSVKSQTDKGVQTTLTYTPFGQVAASTCVACYQQTTNTVTTNTYDRAGRLTKVNDPRGDDRVYTFDPSGGIKTAALPGSLGTTTIGYDSAGEMLSVIDGAGRERD